MARRQIAVIISATVVVAIIHSFIPQHYLSLHIIFRLLYFIPIVYAALALGRRGGVTASLAISLVFLPHFFFPEVSPEFVAGNVVAIILFNLCGFFVGSFRDSSEIEMKKKLLRNNVVGARTGEKRKVLFYVDNTPLSKSTAEWFADSEVIDKLSVILLGISTSTREETRADQMSGRRAEAQGSDPVVWIDEIRRILCEHGMRADMIETVSVKMDDRQPISEKIIRQAEDNRCDLILIGKHNKKKSEEFLFGDTALQVIRKTTIPVLVSKAKENPVTV